MNNIRVSRGLAIILTAFYFIGCMMFPLKSRYSYETLYIVNIIIALNFILFNYLSQKAEYIPAHMKLTKFSIILQLILVISTFIMMRQITL